MRRSDGDLRPALTDELRRPRLMGRIGVGVEKANADRLHLLADQAGRRRQHLVVCQRHQNLAFVVDPLGHFQPQGARHERPGFRVRQIVQVGTVRAANLQDIPEAPGGDEPSAHAFALRERIDDDGRPVHEKVDRLHVDAGLAQGIDHPPLEL